MSAQHPRSRLENLFSLFSPLSSTFASERATDGSVPGQAGGFSNSFLVTRAGSKGTNGELHFYLRCLLLHQPPNENPSCVAQML